MTVGQRLGKLREENNITQIELADKLDVSRQTISKWECDICIPEISRLIKLSELFNVSVDYLLCINEKTSNQKDRLKKEITFDIKKFKSFKISLISSLILLFSIIVNIIIFYGKRVYIIENGIAVKKMNFFQSFFSGESMEFTTSVIISILIIVVTLIIFNYERKNKKIDSNTNKNI